MEKSREKTKYRKKIENIKTTEENKRKGDEQKKKKKRAEVMKKEVQMNGDEKKRGKKISYIGSETLFKCLSCAMWDLKFFFLFFLSFFFKLSFVLTIYNFGWKITPKTQVTTTSKFCLFFSILCSIFIG